MGRRGKGNGWTIGGIELYLELLVGRDMTGEKEREDGGAAGSAAVSVEERSRAIGRARARGSKD
jgi:hypothetical protein